MGGGTPSGATGDVPGCQYIYGGYVYPYGGYIGYGGVPAKGTGGGGGWTPGVEYSVGTGATGGRAYGGAWAGESGWGE